MENLIHNSLVIADSLFFWYFVVLNVFYLVLLAIAALAVSDYRNRMRVQRGVSVPEEYQKPFSILVPAYNEALQIVESVNALLALEYPEHEVIICNDGSTDGTLQLLIDAFELEKVNIQSPVPEYQKTIRGVYYSRKDYRLVVIDKANSGKAATLNVSESFSRYPYVCSIDADSLLSSDSMKQLMQEFVVAPMTVAAGGIIRLSNGSVIKDGRIVELKIPEATVERIQVVEYFRSFLFGRIGMERMNVLMIISGAFGVFRRDILHKVHGWMTSAIGEDMELVISMQRLIHDQKLKSRIGFAPYPVCWTQAPDSFKALGVQRDRWQRALVQSMFSNMGLFFNPRYGALGMLGFPYFFMFEMMGALVEFIGYPLIIISFILGYVNFPFLLLFLSISLVWGMCISTLSLVLAEQSFRRYSSPGSVRNLVIAAFFENFGYRQMHAYWRVKGMVKYIFKGRGEWGRIERRKY